MEVQHCLYQALFEVEGVSLAECCCCSQDSVWCGDFLLSMSKCDSCCTISYIHVMRVVNIAVALQFDLSAS